MNDDIVTLLRKYQPYNILHGQAADEIERLRAERDDHKTRLAIEAVTAPDADYDTMVDSLQARIEDLHDENDRFERRIHQLETKIGWYKAVNAQLQADLAQANVDFQRLARTPAPTLDPLDAIVLGLKREADARKTR